MPSENSPVDLKKKLSRAVLSLPGVAGVGLPAQGLTVYLTEDSTESRARVLTAVGLLNLPRPVRFEISGPLRASVPKA